MAAEAAIEIADDRTILLDLLAGLDLPAHGCPPRRSPDRYQSHAGAARTRLGTRRLREAGFAVRRGDTFPGLGPD